MAGGDNSSLTSVLVAVVVNFFITIAKYVGFALTGSPALLGEAIHSTADVGNQVLLWVGIKVSERSADPEHPYGWGSARYLWNLKSAMGIFFLGCGVTMWHGIEAFHHWLEGTGHDAGGSAIGFWILVGSFVLETGSLVVAIKGINKDRGDMPFMAYLKEGDDPTGVGILLEDFAAVFGVLVALVGVGLSHSLHSSLPDAIATLIIGVLLGAVAVFLAKTNGDLLIGRALPQSDVEKIRQALQDDEIVETVKDLKTVVLGQGRYKVKAEINLYERMVATRMGDVLKADAEKLKAGEDPMKVLVDVVGRSVRTAGREIQRLDMKVRDVAPNAVHVDLELM